MRMSHAALLAVCLLSAVINDASALTYHPNQASISAPNLRDSNTVMEKRVLTSNDANEADSNDDVERAYIPGLSSLAEKLSKKGPTAQNVANKMWLKSKTDPDLVFNMLHLGNTGVKLDDNPRFLQWLNYVDMYSKVWLESKTNPALVFNMLHLGETGVKLDDNPIFLLWLKYVDKYSDLRFRSFSYIDVFYSLRKSNSDEQLVALLQLLRKVPSMKASAEQMQIYLFEASASSRELLNAAWLKSGETPGDVFSMLYLEGATLSVYKLEEHSKFLQWFKYTEMYWPPAARDLRTFKFLQKKFGQSDFELVPLLQALKQTSGLGDLGDNLQSFLFKTWVDKKLTPKFVQSELGLPRDTQYRVLEEYTIYYTTRRGGKEVLKTVQGLFASNKPDEAVAAATNLLH